jgi:hypothetical protein
LDKRELSQPNGQMLFQYRMSGQKAIADDAPFAGMLRWYLKHEHPALWDEVMQSCPLPVSPR